MVVGHGIDIMSTSRIEKAIQRFGNRFMTKIYTEHEREVILLHDFEEMSFPAVAQRMGRSVGSVERLWIHALANLRRRLQGTSDVSP